MLETYNYLNYILKELINKYDITTNLVFSNIKNNGVFGQFDHTTNSIVIDYDKCVSCNQDMINILHHEFRHRFQYKEYKDVYYWWLNPVRREEYNANYFLPINCLEYDAYEFGNTYGASNKEAFLRYYNVKKLQYLYDSGLIKRNN